mmetsp:Transcript_38700/g.90534  ORF Transcript_38700/g.90534 Transcript_38700/m.90534 type:complete len:397 (+) Transcript_38700:1162-2352(+)
MTAAVTFSRRKMFSNVRVTDEVPAPLLPVMAMIGYLWLMAFSDGSGSGSEQAALGKQGWRCCAWPGFAVVALDELDLVLRTEDQADALVQRCRLHAQHRLAPGGAATAGLLDHEADRVGLVQQAQPPRLVRVLGVARVQEDAAAHQDAVRLGHHAGDPAHVEVLAARPGLAGQALIHIACDRLLPESAVGAVDRELLGVGWHLDVLVRQHELTEIRVQREAGHAVADSQHEHRRRAIERIAGGHLRGTGLQEVGFGHVAATVDHVLRRTQDREDAADRNVHVDIGRAVQRVEHEQVLAAREDLRNLARRVHLFRSHARQLAVPLVHVQENLVGQHVQRFLHLSLYVDRAAFGRNGHAAVERAVGDDARDGLAGDRDVEDQRVEVAAGLREAAAFLD